MMDQPIHDGSMVTIAFNHQPATHVFAIATSSHTRHTDSNARVVCSLWVSSGLPRTAVHSINNETCLADETGSLLPFLGIVGYDLAIELVYRYIRYSSW